MYVHAKDYILQILSINSTIICLEAEVQYRIKIKDCQLCTPMAIFTTPALGQACTERFVDLSIMNITTNDTRLVPLLQMQDQQRIESEQWIFPDFLFSCHGQVTEWTFRGEYSNVADLGCRVHITTWRRNSENRFTIPLYDRVSSTENNVAMVLQNEPFVTYQLRRVVMVQPGDVLGVETGYLCLSSGTNDYTILSLSVNGSNTTSYRRPGAGLTPFFLTGTGTIMRKRELVVLIEPVFGQYYYTIRILMHEH